MHKSRIIISVYSKIMINSQDVHFDITRQCAQVELKNIITFNKKNHLGSFCKNGKEFIQQDLLHNFVQFFGTASSHGLTNNISKIGLQRSYGFQVMTDLGLTHWYFSC
jgi:hypothetical protein